MKKTTLPSLRGATTLLLISGFLTAAGDAAILLTFSQKGSDVVITLSGSTQIPPVVTSVTAGPLNQFTTVRLDYITTAQFRYSGSRLPTGMPIVSGVFDSSSTASVFSFNDRAIAFPATLNGGDPWAPTGDLVIKNRSFLTLFGSANPTLGPQTSWGDGTPAFSSVFVVPEPSGAAFLATGFASALLARRNRPAPRSLPDSNFVRSRRKIVHS